MRICCLPEDTEGSGCHPSTNYPYGLFGVEHHYPMTKLLLSDKQKGHSHVLVGHVVVVMKDWWDALLILRHLQTITTS